MSSVATHGGTMVVEKESTFRRYSRKLSTGTLAERKNPATEGNRLFCSAKSTAFHSLNLVNHDFMKEYT